MWIVSLIRQIRNRIDVAENQRLLKTQLERDWRDALRYHDIALAEHRTACQRYHANPSEENRQETWRCFELTWKRFNEQFEIWRQLL